MGKMKELATESAHLYQRNHPLLSFEECMEYVCSHHDVGYLVNYEKHHYPFNDSVKRLIVIKTNSADEEYRTLKNLHEQLEKNEDYKESRICLTSSRDRGDETENEVHVYIFKDSATDPHLII